MATEDIETVVIEIFERVGVRGPAPDVKDVPHG
jgi:hypothetical protein